jgi:hypothetical protein
MKCHKEPRTWTNSLDKRSKLKKIDMEFGTWNVGRLYKAASVMTFTKEIPEYKLHLVGVQEER